MLRLLILAILSVLLVYPASVSAQGKPTPIADGAGVPAIPATPLPVTFPAAFPGPMNLVEVGGQPYSLGTAAMLGSIPITVATNDTVMLAIDALLTAIEADTTAIDGKFTAAAALADGMGTPTTTRVGAANMLWNGATWDLWPGSAAAGGLVDTELPAAVALSDELPNPTVPGVGSYLLGWDEAPTSEWERLLSVGGYLQIDIARMAGAQFAFGQTTAGASIPVVLASDQAGSQTMASIADNLDGTVGLITASGMYGRVDADNVIPVAVDAAGQLQVDVLTEPATAADGAAALPAAVKVIAGSDGGNVTAVSVDAAGNLQVDALTLPNVTIGTMSALVTGAATIGKVDIELAGVAADTDQGLAGTGTQRVKEAQPGDNEHALIQVDQSGTCGDKYSIPVDAYETTCQNQDLADYIRVTAVDDATTTMGFVMAPQSAGAGQTYTTRLRGVDLCFYNDTDNTEAPVYCASDTEP